MNKIAGMHNSFFNAADKLNFLAPLLFRVYLAPIMIIAGWGKLNGLENTAFYFEGLGIPLPGLMAVLAGSAEFGGGILILLGLATRVAVIPLLVAMPVAALAGHWENGWHVLPESTLTMPWEWRPDLIEQARLVKSGIEDTLREHGDYSWFTSAGSITILKNGIEFAATYFIMLLSLVFTGGGRYVSVDYWLCKLFCKEQG